MKKGIIAVLIILVGILLGVGVFILWHKTTSTDDSQDDGIHYVDDKWYSRNKEEWSHQKVKNKIYYLEDLQVDTKQVVIYTSFTDSDYLEFQLPVDREYNTELGSGIYAEDGSLCIRIFNGNIDTVDFDIENSVTPRKNVVYTGDGTKEPHIIANYLNDDIVVVGYVYSNSNDWTVVRDTIMDIVNTSSPTHENISEIKSLPYPDSSIQNTVFLDDEYSTDIVRFMDGEFKQLNIAYNFTVAKMISMDWICAMSEGTAVEYYADYDLEIYFAKSGNGYSIAVLPYNGSYYSVLFGRGEEALSNILTLVRSSEIVEE